MKPMPFSQKPQGNNLFDGPGKKNKKPYQKPAILMDESLQLSLYKPCDATPLDPS